MSYILKEVLANPGNYGGSRVASNIRYLVFHYTGNDGDTASGNANYFKNNIGSCDELTLLSISPK